MPELRPLLAFALLLPAMACSGEVDYLKDIKPVLKSRCFACHGALKQKSGLRLDTVAAMRKGGEEGSAIAPDSNLLLKRVVNTDEHERMPPEGAPLSAEQIAKLKEWIAGGCKGPADEQPEPDPRLHWAYQSPKRANGDIDTLMAARLSSKNLKLQAEAAPELWLRRVYLDLIGIPPTLEQIRAFQSSASVNPDTARNLTVDTLLSSPQYGERWARHFMDIWRYSDWYGLDKELRSSQKHIWHWRDWMVESFNADKGYDRMIVEMLAADEAAPTDRDALRATGFLCRNYYLFNRTTWLDDVIEHTNRAFLGVTMQCVKCHDHKYDPIEQVDYYRMRAVFEPYHVRLDAWPGETDFEKNGLPRAFDLHLDRATYRHVRGDDKNEDKTRPMLPGVPAVLSFAEFKPVTVALPTTAAMPGLLSFALDDQLAAAEREIKIARDALDKVHRTQDENKFWQPGTTYFASIPKTVAKVTVADEQALKVVIAEKTLAIALAKPAMLRAVFTADQARATKPAPANLSDLLKSAAKAEAQMKFAEAELELAKTQHSMAVTKKRDEDEKKLKAAEQALAAARKKVDAPGDSYMSFHASLKAQDGPEEKNNADVQQYPDTSSGRRLAFARWVADTRNPLTARVLVNHLWTRHFGASLVPDVSDFGRRCPPPFYQDALDTLAVDFMEHGWSLKRLHKQMVLSRLYRTSSSNAGADAATLAADPDNTFLWRMNPRRLESQAIRDSLLFVAGKLDFKMGGPSIEVGNESSHRRSLYYVQSANDEQRFLGAFDNASVLECYRRQESIVPQQALALANSKLSRECADAIAARSLKLDERAFLDAAFYSLLGRPLTPEESKVCSESLATLSGLTPSKLDAQRTRALFLQALMSHNDFITLR